MRKKNGFTLVEMLIVITFIAILVTATYLFLFTKGRGERDLENTAEKITALLREANSKAVSQSEGVDWGVRFEMAPNDRGHYILFAGGTSTSNWREFVTIPTSMRFETSTFVSDSKEIIFEKGTGETNSEEFIWMLLNNDPSVAEVIGISASGLINLYDTSNLGNVALNKTATISQEAFGGSPDRGVDGNTNGQWSGGSVFHSALSPAPSWWEVDLGDTYPVSQINIWNRTDCCPDRVEDYYVIVSDTPNPETTTPGVWINYQPDDAGTPTSITANTAGRYVRVIFDPGHNPQYLHLAEVEVMSPQ